MYEGAPPRTRTEYEHPRPRSLAERPDRVAMWAFAMALVAMVVAAASAQAGSGGISTDGGSGGCESARFGSRTLRLGDCGTDVKTLNWILRAKDFGVGTDRDYADRTRDSVRVFERRHDLQADGVFNKRTRRKLTASMDRDLATWYGPGFYGNKTACGTTLRRDTVGVAHRRLPCGTKLVVGYQGKYIRAKVIDRGPYAHGADWDLTSRAASKLNFTYTDHIRVAPIR